MTEPRSSRVTVDIDSHVPNPRLRVLRAVHGLEQAGATETTVAVSSSGEGFHVVGWFDRRVSDDERFRIRENLNDDPHRIRMDRQRAERGLPTGTMWHEKGGNDDHRREFDTVDEAFGHASAHEDWFRQSKNYRNHGRKSLRDTFIPHTKAISEA